MGCCFCKEEDKNSEYGDPTERTSLLRNPVSRHDSFHGDDFDNSSSQDPKLSRASQSKVNRIVDQTVRDIIDVAAIQNPSLEQHDHSHRAELYQQQLSGEATKFTLKLPKPSLLLDLGGQIDKALSAPCPIRSEDWILITLASENTFKGLQNIKVEHKEDLVAQFMI